MLKVKSISKAFGGHKIINNFSYEFKSENRYAIIGANGAGKTTLFNLINGFYKPDSGSIHYNDKKICGYDPYKISLLGIARTFQDLRFFGSLTVEQNILVSIRNKKDEKLPYAFYSKLDSSILTKSINIMKHWGLLEIKDHLAQNISFGQQKILCLAMATTNSFETILLDEPIAGIQQIHQQFIGDFLKASNKSVIFIEHNIDFIRRINPIVLFLHDGKLITDGPISSIEKHHDVKRVFQHGSISK